MILNFLFAFDKNYNTQASVSIYSLLENLENKANIYVILKILDLSPIKVT